MVETNRQVRLDNWGTYFLQRLQIFFSKTDYCDLTLQFEENLQLKVHRLVMNTCTDYFNFLEQSYPAMEENTIVMPLDLQADVMVPIVNFMYTGMLEYQPSMHERLYMASEKMKISILTKLLDAQAAPIKSTAKASKGSPTLWGARSGSSPVRENTPPSIKSKPIWKRKPVLATAGSSSGFTSRSKWLSDTGDRDLMSTTVINNPKPTRFEWPDDDLPSTLMDTSYSDVSLTSRPLWTKEDDQKAGPSSDDMFDTKNGDYTHEFYEDSLQRDSPSNDSNLGKENLLKRKNENNYDSSPKKVKVSEQEDETVITIKTEDPANFDHTKVVSELLRKFPELVKKKKSIKLKVVSTKSDPDPIKSETEKPKSQVSKKTEVKSEQFANKIKEKESAFPKLYKPKLDMKSFNEDGPWSCEECTGNSEACEFVLYYLYRKHMTDVHNIEFEPNLCKYCGKKCTTSLYMAYHLYIKHGLKPPTNIKFPKCQSCPYIAPSQSALTVHIKTHSKDEVQCQSCKLGFYSKKELLTHIQITGHEKNSKPMLDCPYCMKKHQTPLGLFSHVRAQHLKEASRDGMNSLNEKMDVDESLYLMEAEAGPSKTKDNGDQEVKASKNKVKILSNVQVKASPSRTAAGIATSDDSNMDTEQLSTASGTSLAGLVDIVVLDDNQQYILQQSQTQTETTEYILPELTANTNIIQTTTGGDISSTDELVMVLTDPDYPGEQNQTQTNNSNIVVLYSHPVEGQQGQFITSQGNLLVNSDGVLEIRNGGSITTTAGQPLLMSSGENTVTTQAGAASPIESIELIRKEIEEGSTYLSTKKLVSDKKTKEKEKRKPSNEPPITENENTCEMDTAEATIEVTNNFDSEEKTGCDNDHQENTIEIIHEEDQSEHSGQNIESDHNEEIASESEQTEVILSAVTPDDTSKTVQEKEGETNEANDEEVKNKEINPHEDDAPEKNDETQTDDVIKKETAEDTVKPKPDKQSKEKQEEIPKEIPTEKKEASEKKKKTEKEIKNQTKTNSIKVIQRNDDSNDETETLELNFDMFDDSKTEQKKEKVSKNVNKEILDDWDDTDSQHSHKSTDSKSKNVPTESQIAAHKAAADKVTQLMDDWEEEEDEELVK